MFVLPLDPEAQAFQADQSARSVLLVLFRRIAQHHPEVPVCLRAQEAHRLPEGRVAPVAQVLLALPVTFQERYVVTAFFRREPSTRVSLGTRRFVPQTEGTGKEQRRKLSMVNIKRGRQKKKKERKEENGRLRAKW